MRKIPSLFIRDWEGNKALVTQNVNPECQWVIDGEGEATLKIDGTSCLVKDGRLHKRYDAKNGKTPPEGFIPAQEPDNKTGHWPGWLAVSKDNPADKWFNAAWNKGDDVLPRPFEFHFLENHVLPDGTYELIGPKFQNNPHNIGEHVFVQHGRIKIPGAPRTYDGLKEWFEKFEVEGLVWHHPDGRMAKIKRSDFGFKWPVKFEKVDPFLAFLFE